jgi:pyruvate formate lyase activating enzyme
MKKPIAIHYYMPRCSVCGAGSPFISHRLGVCLACIRERPDQALARVKDLQRQVRAVAGLPVAPPRTEHGVPCGLCFHRCRIPEGGIGFCGVRKNEAGRLTGGLPRAGLISWHYDALPTNCVAGWVCAHREHGGCTEKGQKNLGVFSHGCTFSCLYCQNWDELQACSLPHATTEDRLCDAVDQQTSCICFYGGDPTPQLAFCLAAAKKLKDAGIRICWETNGSMHARLLDRMLAVSAQTGGCVKIDLKAFDPVLHRVLTGADNRQTLANFRRAGALARGHSGPPLVIASTTLVPGYIDEDEVSRIAGFIAAINPDIPYSLLAYYPCGALNDLPRTPPWTADACLQAARDAGLTNITLANEHLVIDV